MAALVGGTFVSHLRQGLLNKRIFAQLPSTPYVQVREKKNNKHWDPRFKKERRQKVIKIELPEFDEMRHKGNFAVEEMQAKMKERGVTPPRPWMEKPVFISCTGGLFEQHVPPEGDGTMSLLSKERGAESYDIGGVRNKCYNQHSSMGVRISSSVSPQSIRVIERTIRNYLGALQRMQQLEKKGRSMLAVRKIRSFHEEFELSSFVQQAQQIYIDTHKALCNMDKDRLQDLVTEHCYLDLVYNVKFKTIRWQFLKSLEPPTVVQVRVQSLIAKENMIAQITVRFYSQQMLAVYDRFGRLMHGSEVTPRDVMEYVVFEKHLSNLYGSWRVHAKIIPDWLPPREPPFKTYITVADDSQEEQPMHKVTSVSRQTVDALSTV